MVTLEYMPTSESEECLIEIKGIVTKPLGNGTFEVFMENNLYVIARISGKISRNFIKVQLGDRVIVQLSTYDLTKGRIIYRFRKKKKYSKTKPARKI